MWNFSSAAAASILLAAASAGAQSAKPETAAEAAAAAASAAMERAKRQAAGPMRVILEASKSRRKTAEPDTPTPQPAEASSVRAVASRTATPTAAATVPEAITRSVSVAQPAPAPAPVTAAVASAPAVPALSGVVTQMTLSSEALQGKGASTPVPGLEGVSGAIAAAPLPTSTLALPTLSVGPARVKLMTRVDPQVAQRQLDDMGRNAIVTVDLNIRADGSVSAVTLVPPLPRGIQRAVVAALELWRFEPLTSDRVHRVQLIFNPEP